MVQLIQLTKINSNSQVDADGKQKQYRMANIYNSNSNQKGIWEPHNRDTIYVINIGMVVKI